MKDYRIFVDMDGTIARFYPDGDFTQKGYFSRLEPNYTMLNAIKLLMGLGYDIYIISSVIENSNAENEKIEWLQKYLPELWKQYADADKHIIFPPYGEDKTIFIDSFNNKDILLDDYSKNLIRWAKSGGIAIKCVNGINWTGGSFYGYAVDVRSDAQFIANTIRGILAIESEKVA